MKKCIQTQSSSFSNVLFSVIRQPQQKSVQISPTLIFESNVCLHNMSVILCFLLQILPDLDSGGSIYISMEVVFKDD